MTTLKTRIPQSIVTSLCSRRRAQRWHGNAFVRPFVEPLERRCLLSATADHRGVVSLDSRQFTWDGAKATGQNFAYDSSTGAPCGDTEVDRCDVTLLDAMVEPDYWNTHSGGVLVDVDAVDDVNRSVNFDLYVYRSDSSGSRGALVASSTGAYDESTLIADASGFYLLQVVYKAVSFDTGFRARATLVPPCPTSPPGQGLWDVHPVTCSQYEIGEEEHFYIRTRGGEKDINDPIDVYVRLVKPVVSDGVKVPIILVYSPASGPSTNTDVANTLYGGDPNSFDAMPLKNFIVPKGYALAIADVPGSGNSGGCYDLLGDREQAAGYDIVEALAKLPWSNGKVGMIGGSILAGEAVMTSVARGPNGQPHPPHLATIVTEFPFGSPYDVIYHDGVRYTAKGAYEDAGFPPISAPAYTDFGYGGVPPSNPDEDSFLKRVAERACADSQGKINDTVHGYDLEPEFDEFWEERNWNQDAANLGVPDAQTGQEVTVLVSGGWTDQLVKPYAHVRWFNSIPVDDPSTAADEGVPFKMLVMGNRGHTIQSPEFRDVNLLHAWFDQFLYGYDAGVTQQPPIWSKANDQEIRNEPSWPPPGTAPANLFLRAGGSLSMKPARDFESLGSYFDSGLETESAVFAAHLASGGNFLWFESPPLENDVRISGAPHLQLLASTSTTSTHFTPVLFDLGEQHHSNLFKQIGNQECEVVEQQEVCILSRGFLNARFKDGLEEGQDLHPNERYEATVRFVDKDWVIRGQYQDADGTVHPGHRLGLAVMSSNSAFSLPDQQRAINALFSQRGARAMLELPVVGGKQALATAFGDVETSQAIAELLAMLSQPILVTASSIGNKLPGLSSDDDSISSAVPVTSAVPSPSLPNQYAALIDQLLAAEESETADEELLKSTDSLLADAILEDPPLLKLFSL